MVKILLACFAIFSTHIFAKNMKKSMEIRMPLLLTVSKIVEKEDEKGILSKKSIATGSIKRILRASMVEENHFYLEPYHLILKPSALDLKTETIKFHFELLKSFDQVQELLGQFKLEGKLLENEDLFILPGESTVTFVKEGQEYQFKLGYPLEKKEQRISLQ